jgi:hypothetical protein
MIGPSDDSVNSPILNYRSTFTIPAIIKLHSIDVDKNQLFVMLNVLEICSRVLPKGMRLWGENGQFQHNRASNA